MVRPTQKLKLAVTFAVLVAIVSTGFAPVAHATNLCVEQGVSRAAAPDCGCAARTASGACCCQRNEDSAPPPAPIPDDSGKTLKWLSIIDGSCGNASFCRAERGGCALSRDFAASSPRSLQTLLCVWRI